MEDFKKIEKSVYICWGILNHDLFGIAWCKLESDFNNDEIIWFAVRVESFIDRHLYAESTNFQLSDQYLYVKISTCNELNGCIIKKFSDYEIQMSENRFTTILPIQPILFSNIGDVSSLDLYVNLLLSNYHQELFPIKKVENLKFKKLSIFAKEPRRSTSGSAGYDLYSAQDVIIQPHEKGLIATDIALICSQGLYPRVAPRSGMAMKSTDVGADVIDNDYRGNIKELLLNPSKDTLNITRGDHIAQFILTRYDTPDVVEVFDLDNTERGERGFGSSGR